ncbi:MAG: Helix-turn-helix domain-containing protein [Nitrospira sp.]|nr:MAG: Helix-turn-helix domain-containing protein [Nitrospira sp.]
MNSDQIHEAPLVDADACAAAQGMTRSTFYKMVKAGRIPSYKVGVKGRGLRFSIAEVRRALRNDVTVG